MRHGPLKRGNKAVGPFWKASQRLGRRGSMERRWLALAIIFVSFLQFTLNWFCIVPAFGGIVTDMKITFAEVGLIVGMFIAGYGLAHIPGGWISERYGMRTAVLLGIAIETAGAAMSGWAPSFTILLAGRFLCGVGGSIYLGSAIGLTAAWFRGRELATANGLITGVAFTVGAAIGLFGWGPIVASLGWRDGLLIGSGIGLATLIVMIPLFPTPPSNEGDVLMGRHLGTASLRRVFGTPNLWIMGLAFMGGYGSYFSTAQLLPHYAQSILNVDGGSAETISVILLVSGIPGAFIGGWMADRTFGVLYTFLALCLIEGVTFFLVPHLGFGGVVVAAAVIGAVGIAAFVPWISVPGKAESGFLISDVPTAAGLMLTIVAVGGAAVPPIFSAIATNWGFQFAWIFQGVITIGFALLGLAGRSQRVVGIGATQ